ncbi:hypothetical protein HGRIS_010361 [Hohenbuehelia grisea]|uniref:Methyltransferase domain-containing protein n=1 Tax=Hohenbuehelia grisea TaxID=104357 RepID=A0ABR3J442_9AGAR
MSRSAAGRRRQMRNTPKPIAEPPSLPIAPSHPPMGAQASVYPSPAAKYQPLAFPTEYFPPPPTFLPTIGDKIHRSTPPPPQATRHRAPPPIVYNTGRPSSPLYANSPSAPQNPLSPLRRPMQLDEVSRSSNSPISTLIQQTSPTSSSLVLEQTMSRSSSSKDSTSFVYPTCRSGARPTNASPTSPKFPKVRLLPKRKPKGDLAQSDDGGRSGKQDGPPTSRFRALLRGSKKTKKLQNFPAIPPSPIPPLPHSQPTVVPSIPSSTSLSGYTSAEAPWENRPWITRHDMKLHPYPGEAPYMQAYNPPFLDHDRQTNTLLRRLCPTDGPSFHDYGANPPKHVLDLGCGKGDWMIEAATFWQSHGTRVTGFDLVDIVDGRWRDQQNQGTAPNIRFIRGNFLDFRLPFPDKTFDLVRMANLTLCIPFTKWTQVLTEVRRIMTIGGRLEVVDDQMIFPYVKPVSAEQARSTVPPPVINIPIPSSTLSAYLDSDSEYDDDPDEYDHTARRNARYYRETPSPSTPSASDFTAVSPASFPSSPPPPIAWENQATMSQSLETIFENMLNEKFAIYPRPAEFLLDIMRRAFGGRHASLMRTMHVELAPVDSSADSPINPRAPAFPDARRGNPHGSGRDSPIPLSLCPGIVLWPGSFIPIPPEELQMHALKHVWTVLGCKSALADYVEMREDGVRVVDEEFWDALYDYEAFINQRFKGLNRPIEAGRPGRSAVHSRHDSIVSDDSAFTYQDSVLEYQELNREWFGLNDAYHVDRGSPMTSTSATMIGSSVNELEDGAPVYDSNSMLSGTSPVYAAQEPTHIRTIRVFEALKLSDEVHL